MARIRCAFIPCAIDCITYGQDQGCIHSIFYRLYHIWIGSGVHSFYVLYRVYQGCIHSMCYIECITYGWKTAIGYNDKKKSPFQAAQDACDTVRSGVHVAIDVTG